MPSAQTHEASGANMPDPTEFEGPEEFATVLFDSNQTDGAIDRDRFIGLGHCLFQAAREEGDGPEKDLKRMIRDMAGPFADKDKCKDAAKEIVDKVGSEVVPYVAGQLFDWMDRDQSNGISKDEIDCAITCAMSGPMSILVAENEGKPSLIFSAIDKNKSGSLSSEELSEFLANLVKLAGKCLLVFINVFASTFKDDLADGATGELFENLDMNEDGFLDKEELADMVEGLTMMKEQLKMVSEMGCEGPEGMVLALIGNGIETCKNAGDLEPQALFDLFENLMNAQVGQLEGLVSNEEALPVPPEIVEKFKPFLDIAIAALKDAFKVNMKEVTDAYFHLLDANSDGIVQNSELMAFVGIFDTETSAEDTFNGLFAMVDTDGDGKISKDETVEFIKKVFDLGVVSVKNAIEVYQAIINAVAQAFLKFFIQAIAGGDELTQDKFQEIAGAFAQDGPEVLLAPLMQ
eukprot:TRINITY_DN109_c0_g1_i1.p1 TRINITY_DN109_c0_g1~~TRINITY_DN109_c0_g1_i1.p1  ORF type:complete len:462 (+),score=170.24 TRINITY_DN109_c0_g1_i1:174-1559(+)